MEVLLSPRTFPPSRPCASFCFSFTQAKSSQVKSSLVSVSTPKLVINIDRASPLVWQVNLSRPRPCPCSYSCSPELTSAAVHVLVQVPRPLVKSVTNEAPQPSPQQGKQMKKKQQKLPMGSVSVSSLGFLGGLRPLVAPSLAGQFIDLFVQFSI